MMISGLIVVVSLVLLNRLDVREKLGLLPDESVETGTGGVSTTLLSALVIAENEAASWANDAVALNIMSTDIGDPSPVGAGNNGKRYSWTAEFTSLSKPDTMLFVDVISGTVFATAPDNSGQNSTGNYLPSSSLLSLDSDDAISTTLNSTVADLDPGPAGSLNEGYHYLLEPNSSGAAILSVIGDRSGYRTSVDYNASTDQYITNTAYTYAQSGSILYSDDGGDTWQVSSVIGKMIVEMARDPISDTLAYAVIGEKDGLDFYSSTNSGEDWAKVSDIPAGAGDWVQGIHVLDMVTDTLVIGGTEGIWKSTDDGDTWSEVSSAPDGFVLRTAKLVESGEDDTLAVSISNHDGEVDTSSVYTTTNLSDWTHVVSGTHMLEPAYDDSALAIIDYENAYTTTEISILSSGEIITETIKDRTLRFAGSFIPITGTLSGTTVAVHRHSGSGWVEEISDDDIVELAVCPSGDVSFAGGFGIWHSDDGGDTWDVALSGDDVNSPSAISAPDGSSAQELGVGQITKIVCLDDDHILAGNPGFMEWRH
jgi:hypothetical protein